MPSRGQNISATKSTLRAKRVENFISKNQDFIEEAKVTPTAIMCAKYGVSTSFYRIILKELHIERDEALLKRLSNESKRQAMKQGGTLKGQTTCLERYGSVRAPVTEEAKQRISEITSKPEHQQRRKETLIARQGTANNWNPQVAVPTKRAVYGTACFCNREKRVSTLKQRYGVSNSFLIGDNVAAKSSYNKELYNLLIEAGIPAQLEYEIDGQSYDIRAGKYLIEINPSITHSYAASFAQLTHRGNDEPIAKNYHFLRWKLAKDNGFEQLSLFDWTDKDAFVDFLLSKFNVEALSLGARKLQVVEIDKRLANQFLDENHVLHSCRGNSINLALVDKEGQIYSVMTFGKPRFSKDCDFELLRFASLTGWNIQGAASKLFKFFTSQHPASKILTYSDNNLGNGSVYNMLGFVEDSQTGPAVVWCNITNKHTVKDVSLVMQGADRLLGGFLKDKYFPVGLNKEEFEANGGKQEYAKEYAEHANEPDWWPGNQDIMMHYGYFPVADCGATRWVYTPKE